MDSKKLLATKAEFALKRLATHHAAEQVNDAPQFLDHVISHKWYFRKAI